MLLAPHAPAGAGHRDGPLRVIKAPSVEPAGTERSFILTTLTEVCQPHPYLVQSCCPSWRRSQTRQSEAAFPGQGSQRVPEMAQIPKAPLRSVCPSREARCAPGSGDINTFNEVQIQLLWFPYRESGHRPSRLTTVKILVLEILSLNPVLTVPMTCLACKQQITLSPAFLPQSAK